MVRSVWAVVVLLLVCAFWLSLMLIFLPVILLGEILGLRRKFRAAGVSDAAAKDSTATRVSAPETAGLSAVAGQSTDKFIFDRRRDVSKLFGCNTRNVQYRWSVFARSLAKLRSEVDRPKAVDFGAGSLRDSYELSKLGFTIVSVDLDQSLLQRYSEFYDWKAVPSAPQLFARPLDDLLREAGPGTFDLAIAFDVIEHLEDPAAQVEKIGSLLKPGGLFFTIVPNRRAVFEKYFKYRVARHRRKGIAWIPGVPHLQFKTPAEWEEFFAANGYTILEHEMAIGPLVNDVWHGLLGLPLSVFVDPVLQVAAHKFHFQYSSVFIEAFYPSWLMERVNVWDTVLKKWLNPRFGWNLIVMQKGAAAN